MLVEVDLPPVAGVLKPWVGTEPRRAMDNVAATGVRQHRLPRPADEQQPDPLVRHPRSASCPCSSGITETVGTLPGRKRAQRSSTRYGRGWTPARRDKGLGTEVARLAHRAVEGARPERLARDHRDRRQESVTFLMGIVREGTAIGQVGFVPDGGVTMAPGEFVALVERAGERLPAMPPPAG